MRHQISGKDTQALREVTIKLNGEDREVRSGLNLKELLLDFRINPKAVVIEHNRTVVPQERWEATTLGQGDKVEIVRFVGGGAGASGQKKLVIVESPAKAKTINKFLGNDYLVEASMGHVRDLPKSKMGIDLDHDFKPHYVIMSRARQRVKHLKKMAQGKEGIYLAPDPDREGEAISWHLAHIFQEANGKIPVHRVEFNEITKEAVLEAFRKPRTISMNLVNAQQARRMMDRIVGYELSPLLWRKVGRGLSAGRVQSVALRLVVEREREIRSFVPQEYWSLEAKLESSQPQNQGKFFIAKLEKIGEEKADLKNQEQTEALRREILNLPFQVRSVEKKERQRRPQAPFTTSKLQQEAYTRLGFPAAKTMRVAQKLYEGIELGSEGAVGLITYMRTDSVQLAESARKEIVQYIRSQYGEKFLPEKPPVYRSKKGAQEAHEAIRPSSVLRTPESLKPYLEEDEFKLYDLIWKKALASQMAPALDEAVSISIAAGEKYFFKTTGRRNLFPGFGILYGQNSNGGSPDSEEDKKEENGSDKEAVAEDLPDLTEGEKLNLLELLGNQHFTKPPARFNDASLVKILEEEGIGRPSTYAPTLYTLLERDYVARKGGALIPTELGETVADLLIKHFPKIMEVQFTANMEEELDKIEEGGMDWVAVLKDFYGPFKETVSLAREEMKSMKPKDQLTDRKCEKCQKPMVIKSGRFGKFLACSGFPACRNTKPMPTGHKCPQQGCEGELVERKSKQRKTFYGCSHYPQCTYIANQLPGKEAQPVSQEDTLSETDREILEP